MDFIAALNSINQNKKNLIREAESPETAEKLYPKWPVQKMMAHHADAILWVNDLNIRGLESFGLTNRQHYEFLLTAIEPRKRYSEFIKPPKEAADIALFKRVNKVSGRRAQEMISLLGDEELEKYREEMQEGGWQQEASTKRKTKNERAKSRSSRRLEGVD